MKGMNLLQQDDRLHDNRKNAFPVKSQCVEMSLSDCEIPCKTMEASQDANRSTDGRCETLACSAYQMIVQLTDLSDVNPDTSVKFKYHDAEEISNIYDVSFRCKDIGFDCAFEVTDTTECNLIRKFIKHAETFHNLPVLPADLILKINKAIKKKD